MSGGMVLACEYLTNIGLSRQCILNEDLAMLRDILANADSKESMDFLSSFLRLVSTGKISHETALLAVTNQAELRRRLRGVTTALA
jgi:Tfp pilus assembly pilus retraction ATPase PilT